MIFNIFRATDNTLFKALGGVAYIRNGVGYGFISDKELYHNGHIEIGIGRSVSGRGDWGGGLDQVSTSPIKIVIDKDYRVVKKVTDSFYNSRSSKHMEKIAKRYIGRIGKKFIVKNQLLKQCIDTVFATLPCKKHIGLDVYPSDTEATLRMLNYFTKEATDYNFEDSNSLNKYNT